MKFKNIIPIFICGLLFFNCGTTNTLSVTYNRGLNNIPPGTDFSEFKSILRKPDEVNDKWKEKEGTVYISYYKKGISFSVKHDTVQTIFYYFVSKQFNPFTGTIESDINDKTKIEDIKQKLGEPDRVSKSTVSQYGEFPGATEVYLTYNEFGVAFSFLDDKLANIRQFRPR